MLYSFAPTDPANPAAGAGADLDGLTDLREFLAGLHPRQSGQDADSLPDRWEMVQGFAPTAADPTPFAAPPAMEGNQLVSGIPAAGHTFQYGNARPADLLANTPVTFTDDLVTAGTLAGPQDLLYRAVGMTRLTASLSAASPVTFCHQLPASSILAPGGPQTLALALAPPDGPLPRITLKPETPVTFTAPPIARPSRRQTLSASRASRWTSPLASGLSATPSMLLW